MESLVSARPKETPQWGDQGKDASAPTHFCYHLLPARRGRLCHTIAYQHRSYPQEDRVPTVIEMPDELVQRVSLVAHNYRAADRTGSPEASVVLDVDDLIHYGPADDNDDGTAPTADDNHNRCATCDRHSYHYPSCVHY